LQLKTLADVFQTRHNKFKMIIIKKVVWKMPFGDNLHSEIVLGALNLIQAIHQDKRLENVHISIDLAGSNEFGSYVTIKFAKPNSADPMYWALVDFKENTDDTNNRISTMLMLRRKGSTQGDSKVFKVSDMQAAKAQFEQVMDFLAT
jgi:hypothetical protein